jgi:hypothetical protein
MKIKAITIWMLIYSHNIMSKLSIQPPINITINIAIKHYPSYNKHQQITHRGTLKIIYNIMIGCIKFYKVEKKNKEYYIGMMIQNMDLSSLKIVIGMIITNKHYIYSPSYKIKHYTQLDNSIKNISNFSNKYNKSLAKPSNKNLKSNLIDIDNSSIIHPHSGIYIYIS